MMNSENIMLRPEYARDMQRAQVNARAAMRTYDRELGGFRLGDLTNCLGAIAHFAERLKLEAGAMSPQELERSHQHLLSRIEQIRIGVARLSKGWDG